ncbi:MAG: hypothetical protein IIA58_00930 [Candidatus Marinimicrobia bacterium]|nr:hypothetical protein [Candidatus Neomarinimicrobiota bacterium]
MRLTDSFAITEVTGALTAILLAILSVVVVYFLYRTVYPPQSNWIKIFLRTSRLIILMIIGIQIAMLAVHYVTRSERQKVVGILVDASKSMDEYDEPSFKDMYKKVEELSSSISEKVKVKSYLFDSGLRDFYPFSEANGQLTNISNSLSEFEREMRDERVSSLIIFTDGRANQGEPPEIYTENYPFAIHVVGVGKNESILDLRLSSILTAPIAFKEDSITVTLGITSQGFGGRSTELRIYDGDSLLEVRNVILPNDGFVNEEVVYLSLLEEGEHLIKANLTALEGEETILNNSRLASVNVLSKKKDVLLLSGAPSADYVFMKNLLKKEKDIVLTAAVQSVNGMWYQSKSPDLNREYDVLIFIGYPSDNSSNGDIKNLIENIKSTQASLYYVEGSSVSYDKLNKFSEFLPALVNSNINSRGYREVKLQLSETGKYHPFTRQSEQTAETVKLWNALPPGQMASVEVRPKPGSVILLSGHTNKGGGRKPIFLVSEIEGQKSAMLMVTGSYMFDMLLRGIGNYSETWNKTLLQGIDWLSIHDAPSQLNLKTDKQLYSQGEKVKFNAAVYDEYYEPMEDIDLQVFVKEDSNLEEEYQFDMVSLSFGRYSGEYLSKSPGRYKYRAVAKKGEIDVGEIRGEFRVEEYSPEFALLGRNETILVNIARNTGGTYIPYELFEPDSIKIEEGVYHKRLNAEFRVWNDVRLMLLLLILLAAEWILRKRGGLL